MVKIYSDIEQLPLFNYVQIIQNLDYKYLLFDIETKITAEIADKIQESWDNINTQIIDYMGVPEQMQELLRLKKSIALLRVEKIKTDNNSLESIIEIKEKELQNYYENNNKTDIYEDITAVEMTLKMQIDLQKTSLKRYLSYIKILQKNGRRKN
jgi:hypothetical protein